MIIGTTDDKFDIDTHSTSKCLFYHFNNLRRDFDEEAYKIRHTYFEWFKCNRKTSEQELAIFY